MIAGILDERGKVKVVELAERLGVSHVAVSRKLGRLRREGLLEEGPSREIALTEAGRKLAHIAKDRHQVVLEFLLLLGVNQDVADHDAEGIEHHVSPETLQAMREFVNDQRRT